MLGQRRMVVVMAQGHRPELLDSLVFQTASTFGLRSLADCLADTRGRQEAGHVKLASFFREHLGYQPGSS